MISFTTVCAQGLLTDSLTAVAVTVALTVAVTVAAAVAAFMTTNIVSQCLRSMTNDIGSRWSDHLVKVRHAQAS